jgi:hypothetical protein
MAARNRQRLRGAVIGAALLSRGRPGRAPRGYPVAAVSRPGPRPRYHCPS